MNNDLISRRAAIDALKNVLVSEELEYAIPALKELPSAQQLIPVDALEDIPDHEVICCDGYGNFIIGYMAYENEQWICESVGEIMYNPVAYMEKPEPYQEGQDGIHD